MTAHVRQAVEADLPGARALMLRILDEDFGYGWRSDWYWDIADRDAMSATYLSQARQALFVALGDAGAVLGTTAVRRDGPRTPPNPSWLAARYAGPEAGHLMRMWVAREQRRRGIARALVGCACAWAAAAGYEVLYLQTDARSPGAEAFWRASPAVEVLDARGHNDPFQTIHFEIPLDPGDTKPAQPGRAYTVRRGPAGLSNSANGVQPPAW